VDRRISIPKIISLMAWGGALIAYFFQFPLTSLSRFIIPCLAAYLVLKVADLRLEPKTVFLLIVFLIYLTCSSAISIINDTGIGRILRFLFILIAIVYCSFVHVKNFDKETDIFIYLAVLKSFLIISIAIAIILLGDYAVFRNWAFGNGLGDIYFFNKFMPKVQVQGNALLVVAFIVEYVRKQKITKYLVVLLLGIVFAGNFAYVLGIGLFVAFEVVKKVLPLLKGQRRLLPITIGVVLIAYAVVMPYLLDKVEQKSEMSNQVRSDQIEVLLDANAITGEGLGNYVKAETSTRTYDGDIYFEMQTLYIVNQIGIIGLLLFYAIIFVNIKMQGIERLILYGIYLIYTFWNPYCFDTTQMIATLLIINVSMKGAKNESSDSNGLLSRCGE